MITTKSNRFLLDTSNTPNEVSEKTYETVIVSYLFIIEEKKEVPFLDEVESLVVAHEIFAEKYNINLNQEDFLDLVKKKEIDLDELFESSIADSIHESYKNEIRKLVTKSLKYARLCFLDNEFITVGGNSIVYRNSPQVKLFAIYDIYGNSY